MTLDTTFKKRFIKRACALSVELGLVVIFLNLVQHFNNVIGQDIHVIIYFIVAIIIVSLFLAWDITFMIPDKYRKQ